MRIRSAVSSDVAVIASLIRELADYERAAEMAKATHEQIHETFFGRDPRAFCDLVETEEGLVAGLAVWFINYSTWTGSHGVYLEDIFVRPEFRGRGYGRALLVRLARECVANGYPRVQWAVLDWNTPAVDFYRSLGAEALDEWTVFRLSGDALQTLASSQ
ncbi:MAG TPA: GNAT family N-acetyltransferase [Acidimicrobiales bacterium]|jgi:GNAT superfamily N-acetyltransferase